MSELKPIGKRGNQSTGSFRAQLRQARYRGFAFVLTEATTTVGRRNALHSYPKRDFPWVEDMGRRERTFTVRGFIEGDDVLARRDELLDLVEQEGDGELIHPTLGRKIVALMDFSINEQWDKGRVFEFSFTFIEQGLRLYPKTGATSVLGAGQDSATARLKSADSYAKRAAAATKQGPSALIGGIERAIAYGESAVKMANDALARIKTAVALPGEYGRLFRRADGLARNLSKLLATPATTLRELAAQATALRAVVVNDAARLRQAASVSNITSAAQSLADAVTGAAPTPGSAVRGLLTLAKQPGAPAQAGNAALAQLVTMDFLRRISIIAAAEQAAQYKPTSSDEALQIRDLVVGALDDEITVAGDQGEDEVFVSLRQLRTRVSAILNEAGAQVPELRTFEFNRPMPSLALAQRLYRDPTRAEDLVARADPIHPAFMPTKFQALES